MDISTATVPKCGQVSRCSPISRMPIFGERFSSRSPFSQEMTPHSRHVGYRKRTVIITQTGSFGLFYSPTRAKKALMFRPLSRSMLRGPSEWAQEKCSRKFGEGSGPSGHCVFPIFDLLSSGKERKRKSNWFRSSLLGFKEDEGSQRGRGPRIGVKEVAKSAEQSSFRLGFLVQKATVIL